MAFNTSSPLPLMERLRRRGQSGGGDEVSHDGDRQRKKRKQTPPGGTAAPASRTERGKKVGKKKAKVKGKADGKTKSDATVNWWSGQLPAVTDLDEGIPEGARHAAAACVAIEKLSPDETLLEEIGSGVVIAAKGVVLTAGHVAPNIGDTRRISFADGYCGSATCVAVAPEYDLALLQIQRHDDAASQKGTGKGKGSRTGKGKGKGRGGAAASSGASQSSSFPMVAVADSTASRPRVKSKLVCVGQPGRARASRLEATTGTITAVPKDPLRDQSELGALEHDCPVFAGNSGSPLLLADTGELVGIHTGYNFNRFTACATTAEAVRELLDRAAALL